MKQYVYQAVNEADTARLGARLGRSLPDPATVALCGTLGSGKTRLVQSIAAACGVADGDVVSPTFTLCNEYVGRRPIYHFDVYRVATADEFWELGIEEYYQLPGIVLIEWADRFPECLPDERLEIVIEVTGETSRRFTLTAVGAQPEDALSLFADRLHRQSW